MSKITNIISDGVTFRKGEGSITAAELIEAIEEHSSTIKTDKVVWDFTNAYAHQLSSDDIGEIAQATLENNSHRPPADKTAVIFSSKQDFVLGKEFGDQIKDNNLPYQLAIFQDIHDALIWLYADEGVS